MVNNYRKSVTGFILSGDGYSYLETEEKVLNVLKFLARLVKYKVISSYFGIEKKSKDVLQFLAKSVKYKEIKLAN